jgi:hypothetical protein
MLLKKFFLVFTIIVFFGACKTETLVTRVDKTALANDPTAWVL